jgi:hypothetical protein
MGPAPACYGDSRPMAPVGGSLDPSSFGAFYSCSQRTWTFEVGTADTFAPSAFGAWSVGIDTDGNFNDNCFGDDYEAGVFQFTNAPGQYTAVIGSFDSLCNLTPTATATFTLTSNAVAVTFPWSAIGNSPTLAWNGLLQNRTEEVSGGGDDVPSPSFIDATVEGAVLDSIPPTSPPNCSGGVSAASEQVATTSDPTRAAAVLRRAGFTAVHDYTEGIVSFTGDASAAAGALAAAGVSSRLSPDHIRTAQSVAVPAAATTPPNDPQYPSQWNLPAVTAPGAWAVTTGSHVVVADVDTGVDFTHPDLPSPQLVAGIDETTASPTPISYASGNIDTDGHGTEVAGVIAAATNNGVGLASLGWNTSVMPVKVSTDGTFSTAAVAAGIMWAADNGARIINLSFGGPCPDSTEQSAVSYAQAKGALVVAAAGNGALNPGFDTAGQSDDPSYPAADAGVIAVGATGLDGYRAAYSTTGSYVSMVAPGGGGDSATDFLPLLQTGGGYTTGAGTSFAAPQVAAAAALVLSVHPGLTASQVAELLESTATDLGPPGSDIEYGGGMLDTSVALADTPPVTPGYGTFFSLPPARILDTRIGLGAPVAAVGPGQTINLHVTGVGGIPTSGVAAVVLNVTVTDSTAPSSYLTVWPAGQTRPNSSNIDFLTKQTRPNLVTAKVGSGGQISLYNYAGRTEVIADVAGYYGDGSQSGGSTFVAVAPERMLDTRTQGGAIAAGTSRSLQIAGGAYGVPVGATGVVVNVTITDPTAASYLTVYPAGQSAPTASNLNFVPKQTVPNLVTVKLGPSGGLNFYNSAGNVEVIADLEGYFTAANDASGSRFFPLVNHRILDTRINVGGYDQPIGANQSVPVPVIGQGGVVDGGAAVVMNTTITSPTAPSYLTVYPAGQTAPTASNLNFLANETDANLVTAKVGSGGEVEAYNAFGTVNAIIDVVGWYGPAGT